MCFSNWFALILCHGIVEELEAELKCKVGPYVEGVSALVVRFMADEITPQATFRFEEELAQRTREMCRSLTEWTFNHLEPNDPASMPPVIDFEAGSYRRLNQKTSNREVSTPFGKVTVYRFAYRSCQRDGEPCIFPLELLLGLVQGATPALADRVARDMADTGSSQQRVLARLRQEHGVVWGVKRLREFTRAEALAREPFRHAFQQAQVLGWLETAYDSSGNCKPVLAVGRDGITIGKQPHGYFAVASVATVTVYDRSGRRLGTVYLARMPESKQGTLSAQLVGLIRGILEAWTDRPWPRFCYVTDAGENETQFYQVLLNLRDPRQPARRLTWYRILDYYHATEYITQMAQAMFGSGQAADSWARKMRKVLLQPNGPSRVLHSAAALRARRKMTQKRQTDFQTAYNYLRKRTRIMGYHEFRRLHLPIGSGVTEAACKTVFTQR